MGNYKFRLSDMIPNVWFYKLKDMSSSTTTRTRSSNHIKKRHPMISTSSPINPKASDTHFPHHHHSPKLKSPHTSRILTKRKTIYKPSPRQEDVTTCSSAACCPASTSLSSSTHYQAQDYYLSSSSSFSSSSSCSDVDLLEHCPLSEEFDHSLSMTNFTNDNVDPHPNYCSLLDGRLQEEEEEEESNWSGTISSSATDIIIDMINDHKFSSYAFDTTTSDLSDELLQFPPILTKPAAPKSYHHDVGVPTAAAKEEEEASTKLVRRNKYSCSKLKYQRADHHQLDHNSPGVDQVIDDDRCRKSSRRRKKSSRLRSLAIVKSSYDPEKDFRESMMEMIVENNIRASKDLEDLLASYLSLNSNDYHDLIVKAFEHIWFNLPPSSIDHPTCRST